MNNGVTDPSSFRREMTRFAPKFSGYDQHDSQEFLQYALEGLHNELNRVAKKKPNCDESAAVSVMCALCVRVFFRPVFCSFISQSEKYRERRNARARGHSFVLLYFGSNASSSHRWRCS